MKLIMYSENFLQNTQKQLSYLTCENPVPVKVLK